jgi:tetratricopeptide (TPR) repeat protein
MNIQKLIDQGEQAFKKRNYDYAITLLLEAVNFGPNNRKARELLRKSELKKYETSYPNAAMVAIFGLPKRIGMFFSGLGKGSNPEAYMMACERFLTIDPKNKGVNMALGNSAAHAGHIQSAIVAYETAAEHHPEDVTALKKLGALLVKNGEIQRAHEVYSRAVELDPKDQEAVKARKNVAAEASLKDTGFETAGSSRDLIRNKEEATELERGERIHQTEDDLTVQRREVEEKLAGDPANVELLQDLAEIAQKQKDWDVGIGALEKAHAAKPDNTVIHFALNEAKIVKLEQGIYEANQNDNKASANKLTTELDALRIEHLQAKVKAYPTDLNIRFDLGERRIRRCDRPVPADGPRPQVQERLATPAGPGICGRRPVRPGGSAAGAGPGGSQRHQRPGQGDPVRPGRYPRPDRRRRQGERELRQDL